MQIGQQTRRGRGPACIFAAAARASLGHRSKTPGDPAMTQHPPAEIGMPLDEVDTPALVIDLDTFERNLRRLADRIAGAPVKARPHAKTHKCPVIALKQMELGAVGVCVQKVSEAEAMVYGGGRGVPVTNEVVGRQKLRRPGALG